jgi:hypothetical protein
MRFARPERSIALRSSLQLLVASVLLVGCAKPSDSVFPAVYVYHDNRPPRFQRVKAPNKDELEDLVQLISQRVGRCLERQGLVERLTRSYQGY